MVHTTRYTAAFAAYFTVWFLPAGGGCGSSRATPDRLGVDATSPLAPARAGQVGLQCGDGEFYVPAAMNAKLQYYPDFAAAAGLQSVTDCTTGLAFMKAYVAYLSLHPGFDDNQPTGALPPPDPIDLSSYPEPELLVSKIENGMPVQAAPVVKLQLPQPLGANDYILSDTVPACTGTFIAKNFILTAAHCVVNQKSDAINSDSGAYNPAVDISGPTVWAITWAAMGGSPILGGGTVDSPNVAQQMPNVRAIQYVDTNWVGYTQIGVTAGHDVAILYLNPDVYDAYLPPSPDNGSAMRISLVAPDVSDTVAIYGWGQTSGDGGGAGSALMIGQLPSAPTASGDDLTFTVPGTGPQSGVCSGNGATPYTPYTGPTTCSGDSGGPATRIVQAPTGSDMQPAIVGVDHGQHNACLGHSSSCADVPGDIEFWAGTFDEINFINLTIHQWETTFTCVQEPDTLTQVVNFERCWGSPCQVDTDCYGDAGVPDGGPVQALHCINSGTSAVNEQKFPDGGCPICAEGTSVNIVGRGTTSCSCLVGQCVPQQAVNPTGQTCTSDSNCGGLAPFCVLEGDSGMGTCQMSDGGTQDAGGEDAGDAGGD